MTEGRTYTFDWRPKEHAQVTRLLVREHFGSGIWRVAKWAVIGIVALAALLTVALFALGDPASAMRLAPLVILLAVLLFFFGSITGWLRARQVQRHDPNTRHPLTHILDEAGFHVRSHTANVDLRWDGLHKVRETPDLFLFYYSARLAYYLPKRALDGEAEAERLQAWIRAQLPPHVPYIAS
jgi:hypothetical protein